MFTSPRQKQFHPKLMNFFTIVFFSVKSISNINMETEKNSFDAKAIQIFRTCLLNDFENILVGFSGLKFYYMKTIQIEIWIKKEIIKIHFWIELLIPMKYEIRYGTILRCQASQFIELMKYWLKFHNPRCLTTKIIFW